VLCFPIPLSWKPVSMLWLDCKTCRQTCGWWKEATFSLIKTAFHVFMPIKKERNMEYWSNLRGKFNTTSASKVFISLSEFSKYNKESTEKRTFLFFYFKASFVAKGFSVRLKALPLIVWLWIHSSKPHQSLSNIIETENSDRSNKCVEKNTFHSFFDNGIDPNLNICNLFNEKTSFSVFFPSSLFLWFVFSARSFLYSLSFHSLCFSHVPHTADDKKVFSCLTNVGQDQVDICAITNGKTQFFVLLIDILTVWHDSCEEWIKSDYNLSSILLSQKKKSRFH